MVLLLLGRASAAAAGAARIPIPTPTPNPTPNPVPSVRTRERIEVWRWLAQVLDRRRGWPDTRSMRIEWDPAKALRNLEKHGVSFLEAMTVLGDPLELTSPDPEHSESEFRFVSLGLSSAADCSWCRTLNATRQSASSQRGRRLPKNEDSMSQPKIASETAMRPEYDFSGGVRGKHHEAYKNGTNVVFLDDDVARAFTDSASVNHALRLLLDLAREQASVKKSA